MSNQDATPQQLALAQYQAISHVLRTYPVSRLIDAHVRDNRRANALSHPNPLLRFGEKFYSQNDEDGILLEMCRRIDLRAARFIEFGIGNGLENNTLILLMSGWRGAWLGGQDLAFQLERTSKRLVFNKNWITVENAHELYTESARQLGVEAFDLLSIDLDGNDFHILRELLRQDVRPSIVIAEYNGKFPPPIRFSIDYDPSHKFNETDYCGASLQSFVDLLETADYLLVGCNITGLNAFFVERRFAPLFSDVPRDIAQLFLPADYGSVTSIGHPPSPKTILSFLQNRNDPLKDADYSKEPLS
jgi:hypothetical protein